MNKYEFKSAYDKITLSDDFKREAREKLLAIAGGDRSAITDTPDRGDRAVEIKDPERVKSPARTIIGIVSAAAVLAVCVVGGGYLIKNHGSNIIDPPNNAVTERQWLDYKTALENSRSNPIKPYSEQFAEEIGEGAENFRLREQAKENKTESEIEEHQNDFRIFVEKITVFPCAENYFAVKEYSFVRSITSNYIEIYFIQDGIPKLIAEFDNFNFDSSYTTLIGDGEYLYYLNNDDLCRISSNGTTESILNLLEYDPENPSEKLEMITFDIKASGSGDYLTVEVPYDVYGETPRNIYNYTHVINVATMEEVKYDGAEEGMPKPFVATDIENPYDNMFYQPFERFFTEISGFDIPPVELDEYDSFDIVNNPSDNIMGYMNLYSFVRYFELTPDQIREGLAYLVEDEECGITDYEIKNFIIEDNASEATAFFANKYAIVIGDKIYSPNWLYLHTVDEWREAGITGEHLENAAALCRDFPFTEDARAAFEAKFEEALGYHVSLEYNSPENEETAETAEENTELTYDDLATIDENGNFVFSAHTGNANITLQPLEAAPAPERDESGYSTFDDPVAAATEAINRSKFHGLTILGQVDVNDEGAEYIYPLEDTYGVDLGRPAEFDPRVVPNYTLDAATSVYNDDMVSLHYTDGGSGEFYVNITARNADGSPERYVTDDSGNIYTGLPTDKLPTYVMSEEDDEDHNFINSYGAFSFMYIGGKQVGGVNYFYAYRKSGDMPEDFELNISAKGCTLDDFMDIVAAVVQYRAWGFGDFNGFRLTDGALPEFDPTSVDTEHGTLVLNQGKYLGTGAGVNYEVNSNVTPDNEAYTLNDHYTREDMTEFTGNSALFELPLGFEPTETSVYYMANYAEFHDGYNIQLFHEGRPLLGESETDEDFIEAHNYFHHGYCYTTDKLPYFEDKTPMVQVYNADFSDGNATVNIQAYKGDFGQRYMGFGFWFLPAEPSNLCEDYYNDYVYTQGNGEDSLSRIFAASYAEDWDETIRNHYYGGFRKNGIYYVVTVSDVDEQTFADILAALYQG